MTTTNNAVAATPMRKPAASSRCGERRATRSRPKAAGGRMKRPMLRPVMRLKANKKPASAQPANQADGRAVLPPVVRDRIRGPSRDRGTVGDSLAIRVFEHSDSQRDINCLRFLNEAMIF